VTLQYHMQYAFCLKRLVSLVVLFYNVHLLWVHKL